MAEKTKNLKILTLVGSVFLGFVVSLGLSSYLLGWWSFPQKDFLCKDCNVILISIDTLRQDHLGIYGYSRETSPNIDRFFRDGAVFLNHISQAPNTLPSHMSMLTGLYPQEHKVRILTDEPLSSSYQTMAEILKKNGYTTVGLTTGSQHLDSKFGFNRGFDQYIPYGSKLETTLEFLDQFAKEKKKFFLFLHPFNPHDPYVVPSSFSQKFVDPNYQGNIDSDPKNYAGLSFPEAHELFWAKVNQNDETDIKHLIDLYDAKILKTDELLGEIFSKLEETGQLDKTIVVLTADHGEEFLEHGHFRHVSLFDEVIKIPLLIRHPKLSGATKFNGLSQNVDLLPTILDFLKLPSKEKFSGKSLTPAFRKPNETIDQFAIAQGVQMTAVRTLEWKLLIEKGEGKKLFYLKTDPREKNNVIGKFPNVVGNLEKQFQSVPGEIQFKYETPAFQDLDEKTREKLIKEGYF